MKTLRLLVLVLAFSALAAGCGTSASPGSVAPGSAGPATAEPDSGGDGGTPTEEPDGNGGDGGSGGNDGGGGIITGNGTAHYELSGDVTASGDLPFVDLTSTFDEAAGQAYLTFSKGGDEILIVLLDPQGSAVQFGNPEIAISPTPAGCTFSNTKLDGSSASGSFDCTHQLAITGEQIATASIKGTFEAHK